MAAPQTAEWVFGIPDLYAHDIGILSCVRFTECLVQRAIYESLNTHLVFRKQETEITALFTGAAAVLTLIAGALSLLWFNRLP
jgi:hypothetical protein